MSEVFVGAEFRHAEYLVPALAAAFDYSGCSLGEIGAVSVDVGPGLYTGLRAGMAAAKAIAFARRVPVIPVPSLWAMGRRLERCGHHKAVAVADARRKEVFWQVFPPSVSELASLLPAYSQSEPRPGDLGLHVGGIDSLVDHLAALGDELDSYVLAGEGASLYRDRISQALEERLGISGPRILEEPFYPTASAVGATASEIANLQPDAAMDAENVRAVYLRVADAKPASGARAAVLVPEDVFLD